jgi:hypothetical protein
MALSREDLPSTSVQDRLFSERLEIHDFAVAKAIHLREFALSMSPLLGCDYLFIRHKGAHKLLTQTHIASTLQELLEIFESSPRQSQIVSIEESEDQPLKFTRYDFLWENNQVKNVQATLINHAEQIDFMQMMFNCSSSC